MVPSAGARFNRNITVALLRWACRHVTVSLRKGNTLVTNRRRARDLVSGRTRSVKLRFGFTVSDGPPPSSHRDADGVVAGGAGGVRRGPSGRLGVAPAGFGGRLAGGA